MNYFSWLLLKIIKKIDGQRSSSGIFHLLTGKRSAQTIQDAFLFQCTQIVGSMKEMSRQAYEEAIRKLVINDLVMLEKRAVILTKNGELKLRALDDIFHLPKSYNASRFEWNGLTNFFWERLSLTIQTLSYVNIKQYTFIPVTYKMNTQRWVKSYLTHSSSTYQEISINLHKEIKQFLLNLSNEEAELFVSRLTSPYKTGKTYSQLSHLYQNDPLYTKIYFHSILHRLIHEVKSNSDYTFLKKFIPVLNNIQLLTASATESKKLLDIGKTMKEVSEIRNLKESTIEDHVIELALFDPLFDYESFISAEQMEEIILISNRLGTKKLRAIKEKLPCEINYFQIRLALTKMEENN
ncbi:helix-turn-helix domain-containing protein [Evansella cellulosilytica]|uniref:Helicase Helix-turn-helix domain-containing protein n=1 Tax=Evansella cellulosilytica (strain ATCC 21833 / DSM 2522 / FERM P-1141 / JCM 9156 / N-4) TaxID=649639 RepID=E6TYP3_EVAC2|nr:helix-turn-helix domain-containing protein [Evansella cellulosilytica]ADU30093.1 hypothetical protein Bcell_1831 [Evansella cellulosilytica DSM 2522]